MSRKKKPDGTDDERDTNADGVVDEKDSVLVAENEALKADLAASREAHAATQAELDSHKAALAEAEKTKAPVATVFRKFEVHVPGCTLPRRTVDAETPKEALAKYMESLGVIGLPSAPTITGVADEPAPE